MEYRRLKNLGEFKAKHPNLKICNGNDTKKLCDMFFSRHPAMKTKNEKLVFDKQFFLNVEKLSPISTAEGSVLIMRHKGQNFVIKEFELDDSWDRKIFFYESLVHAELRRRINVLVPRLHHAYILRDDATKPKKAHGIQIMDCQPGETLKKFLESSPTSQELSACARLIRDALRKFDEQRIWHGDLHSENILIDCNTLKVSFIDFGSTVIDANVGGLSNVYPFLDNLIDCKADEFLHALRQVGLPVPLPRDSDKYIELDDTCGLRNREVEMTDEKALTQHFRQEFPSSRAVGSDI